MASVNKVIIVGNLGRDPDVRTMPSGDSVTQIAVATTDTWKDKSTGEKKEQTEWHRIVFFGKLAEIAAQYLKKGSQVYVEGSLRTRKYTDKDGVEKYATDIRADSMQMLGSRQGGNSNGDDGGYSAPPARQNTNSNGGGNNGARNNGGGNAGSSQGARRPAPQQDYADTTQGGGSFSDIDDDIPF